jgi:hypothetical protein
LIDRPVRAIDLTNQTHSPSELTHAHACTLCKQPVPAEKPIIRDLTDGAGRLARNNLVGPHNEHARVLLECETSGGYPEPSLTWWRNGRLVDDTYEIVSASDGSVLERRRGPGSAPADDGSLAADNELAASETGDGARPSLANGDVGAQPTTADARQRERQRQQQRPSAESEPSSQQQQQLTAAAAQANRLIRNRLELGRLTRDDLLANYSCQASNSQLGEPPTSYAMIDMNRKYHAQCALYQRRRAPIIIIYPRRSSVSSISRCG